MPRTTVALNPRDLPPPSGKTARLLQNIDLLPGESSKAHQAYQIYRDLGVNRSQEKVARRLGKSEALIARWSRKYNWRARAARFDAGKDASQSIARQKAVDKVASKTAETLELSSQKTLLEVARLSYADIRKAVKWDANGKVNFVPSANLDDHTAAAIAGVTVHQDKDGNITRTDLKFHNKIAALNLAGQAQNLWRADVQQVVTQQNNYMIFLDSLKALGAKLEAIEAEYEKKEEGTKSEPVAEAVSEHHSERGGTGGRSA